MPEIKPVSRSKFEKFLLEVGCSFRRQRGSHRIFNKPGLTRPVVVPARGSVAPTIIRSNLRTLGIEPKEYLQILEEL